MAVSTADRTFMSAVDLKRVQQATSMYSTSTPEAQSKLHAYVEQIRSKYSYSGGADGTSFIDLAVKTVSNVVKAVVPTPSSIKIASQSLPLQTATVSASNTTTVANANATNTQPTVTNPYVINGQGYVSGVSGSSTGDFSISADSKKFLLYAGIFLGGLMTLKVIGGKR